jgi:hypothetical protein
VAGRVSADNVVPPRRRGPRLTTWLILFIFVLLVAGAVWFETQTSLLQSMLFSRWAGEMSYRVVNGPSPRIRFPVGGPYDTRLGYSQIPQYAANLKGRGFAVTRQADSTPALDRFAARHGY